MENIHVLWCVVVSFIIKNIIEVIDLLLTNIHLELPERFIIGVLLASVLSIICVKLNQYKYINKILGFINHKSVNDDIWQDIIDYNDGTTLHLVRNDCDISYWGVLIEHEEKGSDSWFVLKDYIIEYGKDNTCMNSSNLENPSTIAINLKNIEHVELYYNKDTKIFD